MELINSLAEGKSKGLRKFDGSKSCQEKYPVHKVLRPVKASNSIAK